MTGGPSQIDTFDLKPGHANGGPFKAIETARARLRISEHLPKLARQMEHMALVRSMSTKEGDHGRATFLPPHRLHAAGADPVPCARVAGGQGAGASEDAELPASSASRPIALLNPAAYGPGFLGHEYAPLIVGEPELGRGSRAAAYDASALQGPGPGAARREST